MNNKTLAIILLVLAGLFAASQFLGKNKSRSFDPNVLTLNVDEIDKVEFTIAGSPTSTVTKSADKWTVTNGTETYDGDSFAIESAIGELKSIIAKKVVARSDERASEFETDDEMATHIKAYKGGKVLADVNIGRFSFDQQSRQPISYIKKRGSKETFLVQSFLAMSTKKDFNSLRDKSFLSFDPTLVKQLQFQSGDVLRNINKENSQWYAEGIALDSLAVNKYLEGLSDLKGSTFSTATVDQSNPKNALNIVMEDGSSFTAYSVNVDGENDQFRSSQKPENVFESPSTGGLQKSLFGDLEALIEN